MADEKPVTLSKKRIVSSTCADSQLVCIVHYRNCSDNEIISISDSQFSTIQTSAAIRQVQQAEGPRLDDICAGIPSQLLQSCHGIHRQCYKKFVNVSRLQIPADTEVKNCNPSRWSTRTGKSEAGTLFPQNRCIFCKKERKSIKGKTEYLSKCETESAERTIKDVANSKQDFQLLCEIGDEDLRAKEARYHESCRRDYVRREDRVHHQTVNNEEDDDRQLTSTGSLIDIKSAYAEAFQNVCKYVDQEILQGGRVVRMSMLQNINQQFMHDNFPEFYNPGHTAQKLKTKLVAKYSSQLQFWLPQACCKSELVFSSTLDIGEAVESAFEASTSESKVLQRAAAILRSDVKNAFSQSASMPWPPSAEFLLSNTIQPPNNVTEFIAQVISGKPMCQSSDKTQLLAQSFAEDICSAVTRGRWTMPKHVLLGMSLRHLTGSAIAITVINRYGHCQSYPKILELDTALAYQAQQADSLLPSNISPSGNILTHLCWDNFDINEETPSGSGTTHTTHGIAIQELAETSTCVALTDREQQPIKRKERSFKYTADTMKECYAKRRTEPALQISCEEWSQQISTDRIVFVNNHRSVLWSICRSLCNTACTVPAWSGWISKTTVTGDDVTLSNIGYMQPILHPITAYQTVQECIIRSMEVSKKLQQEFTFITFDYAAAKIAFDIVWDRPSVYKNVIVHLGAFHIMCSYMGALGKMMAGSGFEEIIIEAGVCASGSINQVINGSHYNRAMRIHQNMLNALERLLLEKFTSQSTHNISQVEEMQSLAKNPSFEGCAVIMENDTYVSFLEDYEKFKENVRGGLLGKTAQLWMSYCDCVWVLLRFLEAIKENDLELYIKSLRALCALMFSADHLNYARYLPMYYTHLKNLVTTNENVKVLLGKYGLSVARSKVPACRNAVDLTIEQTINRSAKTTGGVVGFSRNENAYYRWSLTRHKRATFLDATLDCLNMTSDEADGHKANRPTEIRHSEEAVSKLVSAFRNFMNPFDVPDHAVNQLFCLSSGKPASEIVTENMLKYVSNGEEAANKFINERLLSNKVKFHDPLKKQRLQTFEAMAVTKTMTTTQQKAVRVKAERNFIGHLLMMANKYGKEIDLDKLFAYPLSPIPWSLATADGSFMKTNKAQLMHMLEERSAARDYEMPTDCTVIMDGNALLQSLTNLPETFGGLALIVFNCLPKVSVVHFVTDSYHSNSIKQSERDRRGSSSKYVIGGRMTKLPRDFSSFMHNSENKTQLISFLLKEWQSQDYLDRLRNRIVYFVCGEFCYRLQNENGAGITVTPIESLHSSQEEADTRIILHCMYTAQSMAPNDTIVVRSPDTDVFIILLSYSFDICCQVLFDTGNGNTRRLLSINSIASTLDAETVRALPAFHAFTGCDCTSAFVRRGKKGPFKVMTSNRQFINVFCQVGLTANPLDVNILNDLERFVCCMYGQQHQSETSKVRSNIFQSRYGSKYMASLSAGSNTGIDLSLLPPCRMTLHKHCLRANYQSFIWRHAHVAYPEVPSPHGLGWLKDSDGILQIDWVEGDILPTDAVDVMENDQHIDISNEDEYIGIQYHLTEEDTEVDNIVDIVFEDEYDENN
jgi:hypothetical protein